MECVAIFLQNFGGLTPASRKITQGTAPVGSKTPPDPAMRSPIDLAKVDFFVFLSKIPFFGRYVFIGGNTLTSKIAYPEQNRTCHMGVPLLDQH